MQKIAKDSPSGHHPTTLSGYIFTTKARIDNRKENLLNSNTSPTCPHDIANFSALAPEIGSLVWGTPANFNKFHVLLSLLHGSLVVGISQTGMLRRGRHVYSAGRPSRWVLAHILVCLFCVIFMILVFCLSWCFCVILFYFVSTSAVDCRPTNSVKALKATVATITINVGSKHTSLVSWPLTDAHQHNAFLL